MSNAFWKSDTWHIVKAMKASPTGEGIIQRWKDMLASSNDPAVQAWLPHWKTRPMYTAAELAPMWPALAIATGYRDYWPMVEKSPQRLEHELDFARLPRLGTFGTKYYHYFVVERFRYWTDPSRTLEELENALGQ